MKGIAPNVGIKSYTSTRQSCLCQVPQLKHLVKLGQLEKGAFKLGVHSFSTAFQYIYSWPDRMLRDQFQAQT